MQISSFEFYLHHSLSSLAKHEHYPHQDHVSVSGAGRDGQSGPQTLPGLVRAPTRPDSYMYRAGLGLRLGLGFRLKA